MHFNQPRRIFRRMVFIALIAAISAVALYYGHPFFVDGMIRLLEWTDSLGPWAPFVFVCIVVVAVVLLVPGLVLSLGAGFIFGVVKGSICMWIATNLGAAIAFLIGRHALGNRFTRYVSRHEKLRRLSDTFRSEGWKVVMLTRMVPFFPFKLSNYVFGFARFSLPQFCLGTAIGIIPITVFNVYTGSLAADFAALVARDEPITVELWALRILALFGFLGFLFYTTRAAQRALGPKD